MNGIRRDITPTLFEPVPIPLGAMIFLVQIAIGIVLFAVFQELVPTKLDTSDAWPGYLLAAYGGARFVAEPVSGAVADRVERRTSLLVGLCFLLPIVLLMAFVQTRQAYLAFSVGLGLGTAFLWPATYAMTADLYPATARGKVVGFLNVGQFLGFGAGALVGALLVEVAPTLLFVISGVAVGAALATTYAWIPVLRPTARRQAAPRARLRNVLSFRLFYLSALILAGTAAVAMVVPAIRPYGDDVLGISFAQVTLLLTPSVIVGGLLYVPAGHMGDRLGRLVPMLLGQALVVAGALIVGFTSTLVVASLGAAILIAGNVFSVPAWNAEIMDLAPETHRGTLIGFSVALSGLGLAIGPALGGVIIAEFGAAAGFRAAGVVALAVVAATAGYWKLFGNGSHEAATLVQERPVRVSATSPRR